MQKSAPDIVRRRISLMLEVGGSGKPLLSLLPSLLGDKGDVELDAVIVDEEVQRRAAELPFVRELCRLTTSEREFGIAELERAIVLRKRALQKALATFADRPGVVHTLRSVTGAKALLKTLAAASDITMFEPLRGFRQELVLPTKPAVRGRHQIVVAIDDWSSGTEALLVGTLLAKGDMRCISVLLAGEAAANGVRTDALKVGGMSSAAPARIEILAELGIQPLISATLRERAAALVLGTTEDLLSSELLTMLREQLHCPICLVRRPADHADLLANSPTG